MIDLTTVHGRERAYKATRDSKWGKWGAIVLTAGLTILTNHCESVDRRKEIRDEREKSNQRWHAQKAVNETTLPAGVADVISAEATNQTANVKEQSK